MDRRFHALIVAIASVRSASSCSVKCGFTASYSASGACRSAMAVTASVQASAARSRSE
jgi:hypothetical protein